MIHIYYTSKPRPEDIPYIYIIEQDCMAYSAYKTEKGFRDFIARHEIELKESQPEKIEADGTIKKFYYADRSISSSYFCSLDTLPEDAKKYTGLCNGSLVDCYYTKDHVYRPNPNAKNVYIPLSLDDHIAFQKINW